MHCQLTAASWWLRLMIPQQKLNFSSSLLGCIVTVLGFVMHHPEGVQTNKLYDNSSGFGAS